MKREKGEERSEKREGRSENRSRVVGAPVIITIKYHEDSRETPTTAVVFTSQYPIGHPERSEGSFASRKQPDFQLCEKGMKLLVLP